MPVRPEQFEKTARFGRGLKIHFRAIQPGDAALLLELFKSHSAETILHRYFSPLKELSPQQVDKFVNLDFKNDMAIVGFAPFEGRERMLCVGRYFRNPATNRAEFAITVHDEFQRRGIGSFLLRSLVQTARLQGIAGLTAYMLADNHAMLHLAQHCTDALKLKMETKLESGVYSVTFPVK